MKAIILAGGKGERLRPLTLNTPKSLIKIQGRTITEHLLDLFKRFNITDIFLSVGHLKEDIKGYFKDGSGFGVSISYIEEDEPLGTAGPLKKGKEFLKETFIVSNGDELKDIDLKEMIEIHKQNNARITIALTEVDDPSQYGVARLEGSKILEFVEKPKKEVAPSNLINAGLYVMEPDVIDLIKPGFTMLEKDIFPLLAEKGQLYGYQFHGQWFDTGNMERYQRADKLWGGLQ